MRGVVDQGCAVAEFGQRVGGEFPDLDIVFDHEHRHAPAVERRSIFHRYLLRLAVTGGARQVQRENAAFSHFAGHHHFAAGLPGETEHLGQAEPGALADLLGGEEGFEDATVLLLGNADAGILDGDGDIAGGFLAGAILADGILVAGIWRTCGVRRAIRLPCAP